MTFSGTFESTKFANVFHMDLPGNTLDETSLGGFLDDMQALFATNLFYAVCSTSLGVTLAKGELSSGGSIIGGSSAAIITGSDASQELNGGTSIVVSWLGGWHYRGGKPRTYIPGGTTSWLDTPDTFSAGVIADQQAAAIDVINAINVYSTGSVPVAVLGALLGNNASSSGTFAPFVGALVRNQPGSQRRRNRPS